MKSKSLKHTTVCILCLLAATILLAALPVRGEEEIYTDVIRLHIIAANGGFAKRVPGALGSESVSPSWSKDGKIAYSAKLGNYTVAIVDAEVKKAPARSKQQYGPLKLGKGDWESPSWAPDNRHVVCSRNYGIYVVDTWKGTARQILGGKSKLSLPDWSEILYY